MSDVFRLKIELLKERIIMCGEAVGDLLKPGRRYILAGFIDSDNFVKTLTVVYEPGAEKREKNPLILAIYEKCLGVKTA